jgi:hypothetical protein
MWGPNPHSLNPEIIPSRVEISISNFLSCLVVVFLIYRVRFIGNFRVPQRQHNVVLVNGGQTSTGGGRHLEPLDKLPDDDCIVLVR